MGGVAPQYDPSEAQLRWQAFTALAYGAKGILYFVYWASMSNPFHGARAASVHTHRLQYLHACR